MAHELDLGVVMGNRKPDTYWYADHSSWKTEGEGKTQKNRRDDREEVIKRKVMPAEK